MAKETSDSQLWNGILESELPCWEVRQKVANCTEQSGEEVRAKWKRQTCVCHLLIYVLNASYQEK